MRKCVSWNVFVGEKETSDGRWICIDGIERDTGGVREVGDPVLRLLFSFFYLLFVSSFSHMLIWVLSFTHKKNCSCVLVSSELFLGVE